LVQINISTRHGQISDETQATIIGKIEKLPRIFERVSRADVTIDLEKRDHPSVEIRASVDHSDGFVARADSGNVISVVESAVHKLEQQLRKHKEKYIARRGDTVRKAEPALQPDDDDLE
jgi:putative sigma-54 modulation protein